MGKSSLTNYERRILLKRKEEIIAKIEELFTRIHVIVSLDYVIFFINKDKLPIVVKFLTNKKTARQE